VVFETERVIHPVALSPCRRQSDTVKGWQGDAMQEQIEAELLQARQAREKGNEGQARVCARRAAGRAIRAWYQKREGAGWGGDALKQLKRLQADATVPETVRRAAARLTTKVDFEHRLPFEDDPIEDARRIIAFVSADGTDGVDRQG